ncbi:MAG TPA: EAL domain-containing protein, partial [Candidatus Aquilonibacter sp.]
HQACSDWHFFAEAGVSTRIAVNIPAQALGDMRYLDTLFANLEEHDVPADRFILEVLETQGDGPDVARHEGFIEELRRNGIEIEQDDLGSGHSSLVRMDRYPFDAVKIDQELVRGALRNPQRALEFILYLTRLAHALQTPVTVEGLENLAIIEAAAVLGADRGQGFGISPPLPARDVPEWRRNYDYPVDVQKPRTALGAMAVYVAEFAEAANVAQHFVTSNALQGSDLDHLMQRSRGVTREGAHSLTYQEMRTRIIGELHAHWTQER